MFNGANDHPRHATEIPTDPVETWSPPKGKQRQDIISAAKRQGSLNRPVMCHTTPPPNGAPAPPPHHAAPPSLHRAEDRPPEALAHFACESPRTQCSMVSGKNRGAYPHAQAAPRILIPFRATLPFLVPERVVGDASREGLGAKP